MEAGPGCRDFHGVICAPPPPLWGSPQGGGSGSEWEHEAGASGGCRGQRRGTAVHRVTPPSPQTVPAVGSGWPGAGWAPFVSELEVEASVV